MDHKRFQFKTARSCLVIAALFLVSLGSARCGEGEVDSPEKFHGMAKLFAKHKDYESLLSLFTDGARRHFAIARNEKVLDLRVKGLSKADLIDQKIEDHLPANALKQYGFETYRKLATAPLNQVFKQWCANFPAWKQRLELLAESRLDDHVSTGDRSILRLIYPDGTKGELELYRHKGQWYMTEQWLLIKSGG